MKTGLYSITHKETGKMYIGRAKNVRRRFARHKRDSQINPECNGYMSQAIAKHGPDAFEFKILVIAPFGEYLNELEKAAIKAFNTLTPNGYNISVGGFGGSQLSEEVKERRRSRLAWNKGIPQSEEAKRKQSIAMTGRPNPNQGRFATEEQKRKQSAAMKGRTPWNKGIPMAEEQKAKLRGLDKSYTKTPEYRAKMSAAVKAAKARGQAHG